MHKNKWEFLRATRNEVGDICTLTPRTLVCACSFEEFVRKMVNGEERYYSYQPYTHNLFPNKFKNHTSEGYRKEGCCVYVRYKEIAESSSCVKNEEELENFRLYGENDSCGFVYVIKKNGKIVAFKTISKAIQKEMARKKEEKVKKAKAIQPLPKAEFRKDPVPNLFYIANLRHRRSYGRALKNARFEPDYEALEEAGIYMKGPSKFPEFRYHSSDDTRSWKSYGKRRHQWEGHGKDIPSARMYFKSSAYDEELDIQEHYNEELDALEEFIQQTYCVMTEEDFT